MRQSVVRVFSGLLIAILSLTVLAPVRAAATRALGPTPAVSNLYPTTQAAYDKWNGTASGSPAITASFAAGTSKVAFYFTFSGATANSTKQHLTIYDSKGAVYFAGQQRVLTAAHGPHMTSMDNGSPYPNGLYRVDLTMDNGAFAGTSFTVGLQNPVHEFFPVTVAAAQKSTLPAGSTIYRYPAGAKGVAFFYHVAASTPKSTKFQLYIYRISYDASAKRWSSAAFFQGHVFLVTDKDAGYEGSRSVISDSSLGDGQYQALLQVNGQPMAGTIFSIGS